jgi:lysozyme family protein
MQENNAFLCAFNHAMLYEVGPFWNPDDPDVQQGLIETHEQRRKVGYVNIPQDRGGETKYGIAQRANPGINVRNLDLQSAHDIYEREYWNAGSCDKLDCPLNIMHFDGCVNHGVIRACKFLQRAAGVSEDGIIGNMTLAAINDVGQEEMIKRLSDIRRKFYQMIVQKDPSQRVFLNGWLRRIDEVTQFVLNELKN